MNRVILKVGFIAFYLISRNLKSYFAVTETELHDLYLPSTLFFPSDLIACYSTHHSHCSYHTLFLEQLKLLPQGLCTCSLLCLECSLCRYLDRWLSHFLQVSTHLSSLRTFFATLLKIIHYYMAKKKKHTPQYCKVISLQLKLIH